MRNKLLIITATLLALFTSLLLNACKKRDSSTVSQESIEDNANAFSNPSNPSKKAIVDFGNGTCDNIGTFTMNGVTRTFIKR